MKVASAALVTRWDAGLALLVAVAVVAAAVFDLSTPHPSAMATAWGLVAAGVLVARTARPVGTLLVVVVCSVAPTLLSGTFPDFYGSFVPVLAAVYGVAVACSARRSALVMPVAAGVLICFAARVPSFLTAGEAVYTATGLALAFTAGRTMQMVRGRADLEGARADLTARESEMRAREALVAERERIARELHDVIGHDVAVMMIHAGAAQRLVTERPAQASESLAQIQTSGRKAIDELELMLGMLRDGPTTSQAPPGLGALDVLVAEVGRTGLPVSLEMSGAVAEVGEALDLTAYRLVQEALTNVLKHAPGSRTRVTVSTDGRRLRIAVVDDGTGEAGASRPGAGHGLIGMRERVRVFGGTLTAGPCAAGGWAVEAALPLGAAR